MSCWNRWADVIYFHSSHTRIPDLTVTSCVQLPAEASSPSWMGPSRARVGPENTLPTRTVSGSWLPPHSTASHCSLTSSRLRAMMWAPGLWIHTGWVCSVLRLRHIFARRRRNLSSRWYSLTKIKNTAVAFSRPVSPLRFVSTTMWRFAVAFQPTPGYMASSVGPRNQKPSPPSTTTCGSSSNRTTPCPKRALKHSSSQVSRRSVTTCDTHFNAVDFLMEYSCFFLVFFGRLPVR